MDFFTYSRNESIIKTNTEIKYFHRHVSTEQNFYRQMVISFSETSGGRAFFE